MAEILVAGALHRDVIVSAPHLPARDETVTGSAVAHVFGGKGGNQALAAARHGARVAMAGRVGDDAAGAELLATLDAAGVDRSRVQKGTGASGMSVAILDAQGNYGAVIVSGANLGIAADAVTIPDACRILMLQNEIPEAVNLALARRARAAGAKVILNAAPARPIDPDLLALADLLVVNRVEAEGLTGLADPAAALARLGAPAAIVTLGARGLLWREGAAQGALPARDVAVLSSHGAGDAFLGAFAARLASGDALAAACDYANAAAALHVATPPEARADITPEATRGLLG